MKLVANPYRTGQPLTRASAFVGRSRQLEQLRALLLEGGARGIWLRGQRRIGKSSLLHRLRAAAAEWSEPAGPLHAVYFDPCGRERATLDELARGLSQAIARALQVRPPRATGAASVALRDIFLPELVNRLGDARLVLLIDSVRELARPERLTLALELKRYLEALAEELPGLTWVAARELDPGPVASVGAGESGGGVTYQLDATELPVIDIPPFDFEELGELVRSARAGGKLRWSAKAEASVWAFGRGHPELSQLLCSEVWEELNYYDPSSTPMVTDADVVSAASRAASSAEPIVREIWGSLLPESRVVLAAIAEESHDQVSPAELRAKLDARGVHELGPRFVSAPDQLERAGLIERLGPQGADDRLMRIYYPLLRRAVQRHRPLRRVQAELDHVEPEADRYYRDAHAMSHTIELRGSDAVVARLRAALELNPNHAGAMALLADVLLKDGEEDEAIRLLERLYEIQPEAARPQVVEVLLNAAEREADEERRLALYERVLEFSPEHADSLQVVKETCRRRAEEALELGDLLSAQAAYERGGFDAEAHELELELQDEALEEGLEELRQLRAQGDSAAALELACELAERYPGGHEDWDALLARLQQDGVIAGLYDQGLAALEAGDRTTAQALLGQVASHDPNFREVARYLYEAVEPGATTRHRIVREEIVDEEDDGEDDDEVVDGGEDIEAVSAQVDASPDESAAVLPPVFEPPARGVPTAETVEAEQVEPIALERAGARRWYIVLAAACVVAIWYGSGLGAGLTAGLSSERGSAALEPAGAVASRVPADASPPRQPPRVPEPEPRPKDPEPQVDVEREADAPPADAGGTVPAAAGALDVGPELERARAAARSLDPDALRASERELMTAVHDRARGVPGAEQLHAARLLRSELLLLRALSISIARSIEPSVVKSSERDRVIEDLARARAELRAVPSEGLSDALAQQLARTRALEAIVDGQPVERALDQLPQRGAEDVRALALAAPLWRERSTLDVDALEDIGEGIKPSESSRIPRLLEAIVAFRTYRLTQTGTDKKRARVLALALRSENDEEPIAWALHRALTRPPAARDIHGVFRLVRTTSARRCSKPAGSEPVRLTLRIEPREGTLTVQDVQGGGDELQSFRACVRSRAEALRFQPFSAEPHAGAELVLQ